jgi:hypothetical protein
MTHSPELELMRNYITSRRDLTEKVKLLPIDKQEAVLAELQKNYSQLLALKH